jgi:hypothetical protein
MQGNHTNFAKLHFESLAGTLQSQQCLFTAVLVELVIIYKVARPKWGLGLFEPPLASRANH